MEETYSNVIICTATGNNMMRILRVFPNPVASEAAIELDLSENDDVLVSLFDGKGAALFQQVYQVDEGVHQISIPLTGFHQGIYMLRINCEYGTYAQKLIKM